MSPLLNPICTVLPRMLENGISKLNKAIAFQSSMKRTVDALIAIINLEDEINKLPGDINPAVDTSQINAILTSCPGMFPDLPGINLAFKTGIQDTLKFLNNSPLGVLNSYMDSLDGYMKPIANLADDMLNYLTCMKNLCGLAQSIYDQKFTEIVGLKTGLNLDSNGKPQILNQAATNARNSYMSKVNGLKDSLSLLG